MPYACCVPGCRGNYKNGPKVHAFRFPTDAAMAAKWIRAIHRENFAPSKFSRVCELHFAKENIKNCSTATDSKTGETITVSLKIPRLKRDAVPTQLPNCPSYLSKTLKLRPSRDEKLQELENENFAKAIRNSKTEFETYQKAFSYTNFKEFLVVFNAFQLPECWFKISDLQKVTLFKLKYSPGPVITYSVIIHSDLKVETFLYGREIQILQNDIKPDLKTPFTSNNINEVKDLLFNIDKNSEENEPEKRDENKSVLNHISNLLHSLVSNMSDEGEDSFENNSALAFISEQLKLHTSNKARYRYSNNTMILASILQTISPHAYKYLRHCGVLILPHPDTVKSICSSLLTDPTMEERNMCLNYAKNLFKLLSDREKYVILLVDEIHIKPFLDYKAGNIVGTAYNNACLANSAFVFMISSIMSSVKEVVHISPTSKVDHLLVFSLIKEVITKLEDIGYKVFCVISDNNAVNSKAMSHFAEKKSLSIVYPHPTDKTRPLFYLFDSVHLLKCIRNNWLNAKPDQTLYYPDFDSGVEKAAAFQSLKTLHQLEHDKMLKVGYSLNLKALFPTNMERQNVSLALKVFNPFVEQALIQFGAKIDKSKDTADFINTIVRWWKIVNVKTPLKGKRLNDEFQEPLTAATFLSDKKFLFLNHMLNWLEKWKTKSFSNKLTTQTHTALTHTLYGMTEVIQYCFSELKMNYVLLGKFQTDDLENRFGRYRQLAGGQYHISLRQLYESEKRLRIQSLLTLKSRTFGNIQIKQFCENIDIPDEIEENHSFNPEIMVVENDVDNVSDDMPVITYLAGYCCYITQKKIQCEICKEHIIYNDEFIVEDNFTLIKSLSRGKLLYPQEVIVRVVLYAFVIFNKILDEFEESFLTVHNKRAFLTQYILKFILENGHLPVDHKCTIHTIVHIAKIVITCTANTLLKNYCGKSNDRLAKSSKSRKLKTLTK